MEDKKFLNDRIVVTMGDITKNSGKRFNYLKTSGPDEGKKSNHFTKLE
ncbi:MAG: hypothetical protein ACXAEU_06750 [Candidatus Hodarchaeales archaeon]|jgi:hypothetical protein